MGPSFPQQVSTFTDEFDIMLLELMTKVCDSTGQTHEEFLAELESIDIDSDEDSNSDDDDDTNSDDNSMNTEGVNDEDTDLTDTSEVEMWRDTINVASSDDEEDMEVEEMVLRPLPVNTYRPMYLLQRSNAAGKENRDPLEGGFLQLPKKQTLRNLMKW
jgi:hypothetical protein